MKEPFLYCIKQCGTSFYYVGFVVDAILKYHTFYVDKSEYTSAIIPLAEAHNIIIPHEDSCLYACSLYDLYLAAKSKIDNYEIIMVAEISE